MGAKDSTTEYGKELHYMLAFDFASKEVKPNNKQEFLCVNQF